MSTIYVSYSRKDRDFVLQVTEKLSAVGHRILIDDELLQPGIDWRSALKEGMRQADVFIAFLSEYSVQSPYVIEELVSARALADINKSLLLIPVVIDKIPVPEVINDLFAYIEPDRDSDKLANLLQNAIAKYSASKELEAQKIAESKREATATSQRIESNATVYIEEALTKLGHIETRYRFISNAWYLAGFLALITGAAIGGFGLLQWGQQSNREWVDFALVTLKTIVVLSLLGACSKYAFSLGRSYVTEALKSADRIHAISFGKFYLKAFGGNAEWSQLKEVFQHWNIDKGSSFLSSSTTDFDPKIVEKLTEIAKQFAQQSSK